MVEFYQNENQVKLFSEFRKDYLKELNSDIKHLYSEVFDQLNFSKRDRVLEAGIGTAENMALYSEPVHFYGVDVSEKMVEKAREKVGNGTSTITEKVCQGDVKHLEFGNERMDKTVATMFLSTLDNPEKALSEMKRVTKKGGRVGLFDYHKAKSTRILREQAYFRETLLDGFVYNGEKVARYDTLYDLDDIIDSSSFEKIFDNQIEHSLSESFRGTVLRRIH